MKKFGGKWKWSKKRGAMVLKWKSRKVKTAMAASGKDVPEKP